MDDDAAKTIFPPLRWLAVLLVVGCLGLIVSGLADTLAPCVMPGKF